MQVDVDFFPHLLIERDTNPIVRLIHPHALHAPNFNLAHGAYILLLIRYRDPATCSDKMLTWMEYMKLILDTSIRLNDPELVAYTARILAVLIFFQVSDTDRDSARREFEDHVEPKSKKDRKDG